jgi:Mrp family chromosome partitioning ATPase/capsular polysaccharide biosynthesis protein
VRYLQALRSRWPLIAALAFLAVGAAILYSATAQQRFVASADLLVTPVSSGDDTFVGFSLLREGVVGGQSVVTAARLVVSPPVVEAVNRRLTTDNAKSHISVKPLGQSSIVTVEATAAHPDAAAAIANAFANQTIANRSKLFQRELSGRIAELSARLRRIPAAQRSRDFEAIAIQQRLAELTSLSGTADPTLSVLSRAVPPAAASWPRPALSIVVALLAALLLGAGLAVALEVFDPRISREEELTESQRLPVLARLPRLRGGVLDAHGRGEPLPPGALKAYRVLRANLALAGQDFQPPKSILITSAQPADGKSMTAVNLARTFASSGARVILIDWDMHRPSASRMLGDLGYPDGLPRALRDPAAAPKELVPIPEFGERLRVLVSSADYSGLARRLNPANVRPVIDALQPLCDVIVMDSPPLLEVAETIAVAEVADAVLIAVRLGHTRRDRLTRLRQMLALRAIEPVGFVVTVRGRADSDDDTYYDEDSLSRSRGGRQRRRGRTAEEELSRLS